MNFDSLSRYAPHALGLLRIVTAVLFIQHGTQKLFGFPASQMAGDAAAGGLPPLMLVAAVLEIVGGAAILLGLLTRPVAFVLSGMMAVAYWMAHAPMSIFPIQNFGETAIMFCFVFLYLVFAGPGAFSVDGTLAKQKLATA
ncbi:MAG TPA: DoxX family protein [Devosia sp.]|nr:DoxX family protein [Devosia sp.]